MCGPNVLCAGEGAKRISDSTRRTGPRLLSLHRRRHRARLRDAPPTSGIFGGRSAGTPLIRAATASPARKSIARAALLPQRPRRNLT